MRWICPDESLDVLSSKIMQLCQCCLAVHLTTAWPVNFCQWNMWSNFFTPLHKWILWMVNNGWTKPGQYIKGWNRSSIHSNSSSYITDIQKWYRIRRPRDSRVLCATHAKGLIIWQEIACFIEEEQEVTDEYQGRMYQALVHILPNFFYFRNRMREKY